MMKKTAWLLFVVIGLLIPVSTVIADDPGFTIKMNRDWGYGGMGQIQGTFSIIVKDELDFTKVIFMMDDVEMTVDTEEPFRFQFSTDSYPAGRHEYWAIGELKDGTILESNRIGVEVLSKEDANADTGLIFGIIFGAIAVVAVLSTVVTSLVSKKVKKGAYFGVDNLPAGFNIRGGTICPKCGEPYAYHLLSANLLTHKLDRCPHCGKYAISKMMSRDKIIEVVQKLHGSTPEEKIQAPLTEEEKLRNQLDESKYME